jgi:hypothetical protein
MLPTIAFGAHDVGLSTKPGRSIRMSSVRSRSGTPLSTVGSGSDTTVRCASSGSTNTAWRTTTVPRS